MDVWPKGTRRVDHLVLGRLPYSALIAEDIEDNQPTADNPPQRGAATQRRRWESLGCVSTGGGAWQTEQRLSARMEHVESNGAWSPQLVDADAEDRQRLSQV